MNVATDSLPAIPHARPSRAPGRFTHLWMLWPFALGLILGTIFIAQSLLFGDNTPTFAAPTNYGWSLILLSFALGVAALAELIFATAAFTLLAIQKPNHFQRPSIPFCILIGAAIPLIAAELTKLTFFLRVIGSPGHWYPPDPADNLWFGAALYAIPGLTLPLLLIRRKKSAPEKFWPSTWRTSLVFIFTILAYLLYLPARDSLELSAYQHKLDQAAAWVSATYPHPSTNSAVTLPPQFSGLTENIPIQAQILPDGRVLLLIIFNQDSALAETGYGALFTTAPLTPKEIAPDSQGRNTVQFPGLREHHITGQLAPRLYTIEVSYQ